MMMDLHTWVHTCIYGNQVSVETGISYIHIYVYGLNNVKTKDLQRKELHASLYLNESLILVC